MSSASFALEDLNKYFHYDPEEGVVRRFGSRVKRNEGHVSTGGYLQHKVLGKNLYAHRIAWAMTYKEWPTNIDHRNGNRQDNRISNLRSATGAQNSRNLLARPSATNLKGVSPKRGGYVARITVNLHRHRFGPFGSPVDAALAYDRAAIYFHGDFAATNFSLGLL